MLPYGSGRKLASDSISGHQALISLQLSCMKIKSLFILSSIMQLLLEYCMRGRLKLADFALITESSARKSNNCPTCCRAWLLTYVMQQRLVSCCRQSVPTMSTVPMMSTRRNVGKVIKLYGLSSKIDELPVGFMKPSTPWANSYKTPLLKL